MSRDYSKYYYSTHLKYYHLFYELNNIQVTFNQLSSNHKEYYPSITKHYKATYSSQLITKLLSYKCIQHQCTLALINNHQVLKS